MARYSSCIHRSLLDRQTCLRVLPAVLLALLAGGCGDPSLEEPDAPQELASQASELREGNGLGSNGLGSNGLGSNGLGSNGLSLSTLNSASFVDWFNQDPALADMVMSYVTACAVSHGSSLTWTNPVTNTTHKWNGNLGLTPGWAGGAPATELEQQLITACLAAHTNKYGVKVNISIQGLKANNSPIPVGWGEFSIFAQKEACFFGNLFQNEGIFAGNDSYLLSTQSSVRACGLEVAGAGDQCAPIHHVSNCSALCTPDYAHNYFQTCYYNGKSYRALTTRIKKSDVYVCGDGVCQISESCGTGFTPNNCRDCGPCP
ncbi:MAG: hypothetical protein ACJ8AT_20035 [Hyalangium sp.]|uniref:hypothetical protein n=1 Tax=Hyalangium sp. TaxID=2028555 RepID=UPI00389A5D70